MRCVVEGAVQLALRIEGGDSALKRAESSWPQPSTEWPAAQKAAMRAAMAGTAAPNEKDCQARDEGDAPQVNQLAGVAVGHPQ